MASGEPGSPPVDTGALFKGIQRALPGLDSFLRDRLAQEHLTPEVEAQLAQFVQILDQLEIDAAAAAASSGAGHDNRNAARISTAGPSDMDHDEDVAYSGFLVQGTRHVSNILTWPRRWCVLLKNDCMLKAYGTRSRTPQKALWELDLRECQIVLMDPRDAGDKTNAFKIVPPKHSEEQPLLVRTYEESEMYRCLHALETVTGIPHSESEPHAILAVPMAGARLTSASPNTARAGSAASHHALLPSGERIEIDDGDGVYDVPPSRQTAINDSTYDVPPSRPSGGPSRSASDFDFPPDEHLHSPKIVVGEADNLDDLYAEPTLENGTRQKHPHSPTIKEARSNSNIPAVPERTSGMLITSGSEDRGSQTLQEDQLRLAAERASQARKEEQMRAARQSYGMDNGEDLYEKLPEDVGEVHLSDSNTDDREGLYEPLDFDGEMSEGSGYTSSGSVNSIVGFFKSSSKKKKKQQNKERRHRLTRSVADLVDPDQDGYLAKRSGIGLTWRRRWCVLKDMCLYYFRSMDDTVARNSIILPGWRLVAVSDETKRPYTFKLSHEGMTDCFFSADSADSYETWIASLERCLRVPNGNEMNPHDRSVAKAKTTDELEAEKVMKAIGSLSAPQWSAADENVPGAPANLQTDSLYDHPRANAGSLTSDNATANATANGTHRYSPAPGQGLAAPPPIPNGPRPSPGPGRKGSDAPVLPPSDESALYEDVPRGMKRQTSEYDTDLYLAPAEARSGRNTPSLSTVEQSALENSFSGSVTATTPASTAPNTLPSRTSTASRAAVSDSEVDGQGEEEPSPFKRKGLYGSLSRMMRRSHKNKIERTSNTPSTISISNGVVGGVLNRRGPLKKWTTHFCQLKHGKFYCYKGEHKASVEEGTILHETRLLGQEIGNADRDVKRANSLYLMKAQHGGSSGPSSRALFFQADNDDDYRLWFKHLKEATQIQVQAVSDVSAIHKAGRHPPATMELNEARRVRSPARSPHPDGSFPDSGYTADEDDETQVFPESLDIEDESEYQVPRPSDHPLPNWLQEDLGKKPEAATAAEVEAEVEPGPPGRECPGNPIWWSTVSSSIEEIYQGPLTVKHGTLASLRSWQSYWCTVAERRLNCFRRREDTESILELQLGGQLVSHAPERGRPYCFNVFVNERQAVCLSAETKKEMDEWMTLLLTINEGAAAPEKKPAYGNVPDAVFTADKPVVRDKVAAAASDAVPGLGYFHPIQSDRSRVPTRDSYYPPDALLPRVAKAPPPPTTTYQPGSVSASTALPPVYKPAINKQESVRSSASQATTSSTSERLYDGYLQKRSGPSLWHRRYCFLQGTTLYLYSQKGSQKPIQTQQLATCALSVTSKDGLKDAFKVTPPSPHPRIYLQASSSKERGEWMEALQKAIMEASGHAPGAGLAAGRKRRSFRRPKSNVISMATSVDSDEQPKKRGFLNRLRSWSQENISRGGSRHSELVEPTRGESSAYSSGYDSGQQPQPFVRGAVSLGHGEFRRGRGGAPVSSAASKKSMSGLLFVNYGNGEGSVWCEVANGTLSTFTRPQDRAATYSAELGGAHIKHTSHVSPQDRVVTVEGGSVRGMLQIRVPGQAKTFDEWINVLQAATVINNDDKPLKRSWSTRLRRSFRRSSRPQRKRNSEPAVPALDLATSSKPSPPMKPLGSRPLPRPPGQLPPPPPGGMAGPQAGSIDELLPGYASKLTTDLNALTSAADAEDTVVGRKDSRTPSLPSDDRRPSQLSSSASKDGKRVGSRSTPSPSPASEPPTVRAKPKKSPSPDGVSEGRSLSPVASDTSPPSANLSKQPSASSLEKPAAKKTAPPAPKRNDAMSTDKPALSTPVIRQVKSSPRPRAHADVHMAAPPPPPSTLSNPILYTDVLKEYEGKAKAVNVQAAEQRANLTQDRVDLVRQQVDLEDRIRQCNVRLAAVEAKAKNGVLKGRAGDEPYELKRERAELQNKGGYVEGKIQRIDDQILRVSTELATAIDRLEKERNQRIEYMASPDMESAM